jgi:hypothetical protein
MCSMSTLRGSGMRRARNSDFGFSRVTFNQVAEACLAAFGGPQKDAKVMTGSQSVVPEETHHRAAQHGRMSYRFSPRGHLQ